MGTIEDTATLAGKATFRHEALLYAGEDGVLSGTLRVIGADRGGRGPAGRRGGGGGEPIGADRSPAELVECQRHEALLNLAFADGSMMRLLCPYDTDEIDSTVIPQAHCNRP